MGQDKAGRFEALASDMERPIYLLCLRMTGSREDAQDCAQEALLRAYRAFGRFRGEANARTWLYRVARNVCIDFLRARRQTVSLDSLREAGFDMPDEATPSAYMALDAADRKAALERAIALLPDDQREILILRDMQGLAYDEIGRVLRLPPGTVKSRLNRARERLRGIILANGELTDVDFVHTSEGRRANEL